MKTFFDIIGVILGCVCVFTLIASTGIGNPTLLMISVGCYISMIGCYSISSKYENED